MNTLVHVHVVVKLFLQLLFAKIILLLNNFCKKKIEEISNVWFVALTKYHFLDPWGLIHSVIKLFHVMLGHL